MGKWLFVELMNLCFANVPEILCLEEHMEESLELACPYEGVYLVDWTWVKLNVLVKNIRLS